MACAPAFCSPRRRSCSAELEVSASQLVVSRRAIRSMRITVLVAALTGVVVTILVAVPLGFWAASTAGLADAFIGLSELFGYQQALAPLAGAAATALVIAAFPLRFRGVVQPVRTANLTVRRVGDQVTGPLIVLASSGLALVLVLVSMGVTASDLGTGSKVFVARVGNVTISAPYPGWSFGGAVIAAAIVVGALIWVALVRVDRSPGVGVSDRDDLELKLRGALSRFVVGIGIAAISMAAGTVLWGAGTATAAASRFDITGHCRALDAHSSLCQTVGQLYSQPSFAIGLVEIIVGAALVAASLAVVIAAVRSSELSVRVLDPAVLDAAGAVEA